MANTEKIRPIELEMISKIIAGFIQRHDPERPEGAYCRLEFGELDTERKQFTITYYWYTPPEEQEDDLDGED